MAFHKEYGEEEQVVGPACIHLRNKGMYVSGQAHSNGGGSGHHCWCNLTQHVRGPDNNLVSRGECGSDRECFRATL